MADYPSVVLDDPPFGVNASLSPAEVAMHIERFFAQMSQWPDQVSACFAILADLVKLEVDSPLRMAGAAIAADMDAGLGVNNALPYHNRQHFCEVMLGANYIGLLGGLTRGEQGELLLAALIHDFGHDGKGDGDTAFRLERLALQLAQPYFARYAVPGAICERINAAVLATEVRNGLQRARAWYRFHFQGQARPEGEEPAAEFGVFAACPECSRMAVSLTEADVLGSVGLTPEYARLQQRRLAREWGRALGFAEQLHYLDNVFGKFMVADFFASNLEEIRRQNQPPVDSVSISI